MSKHTPGPWTFLMRDASKPLVKELVGRRSLTGGGMDVLGVTIEKYGPLDEESEANARLIEWAPTMLKGMKLAVSEFERIAYQKKCDPEILQSLKDCIAKAEGEK